MRDYCILIATFTIAAASGPTYGEPAGNTATGFTGRSSAARPPDNRTGSSGMGTGRNQGMGTGRGMEMGTGKGMDVGTGTGIDTGTGRGMDMGTGKGMELGTGTGTPTGTGAGFGGTATEDVTGDGEEKSREKGTESPR